MRNEDLSTCCLLNEDIRTRFHGKEIYVFGAGVFGEVFRKSMGDSVIIKAFIDNGRAGAFADGIRIIGLDEMKRERGKEPIVITTECYAAVIADQLKKHGFQRGEDFFIWDEGGGYHLDSVARRYIEYNQEVFNETERYRGSKRKVLIPFAFSHNAECVIFSFIGNYFSRMYEAEIWAYVRGGRDKGTISGSIQKVYESFNTTRIFAVDITKDHMLRAEMLLNEWIPELHEIEDWHKITIKGICVGPTIVNYYLRFVMLDINAEKKDTYQFLKTIFAHFLYWYDLLEQNEICVVVLMDKGNYDGFVRDIACAKGIPVYAEGRRLTSLYSQKKSSAEFKHYKMFWNQLTEEEKRFGIEWGKRKVTDRLAGRKGGQIYYGDINAFDHESSGFSLPQNGRPKVVICPHIFEEDTSQCGPQLFADYATWLIHLAGLAKKTNYDWYIKEHPSGSFRDRIIIDKFIQNHPYIRKLPLDVSPSQLKKEGVTCALTIYGTIGSEYPLLGIPVVNAGNNPHISFGFNINPKTREEYDRIILEIQDVLEDFKFEEEEVYEYYCIQYLYYYNQWEMFWDIFFDCEDRGYGNDTMGSWRYDHFMKQWPIEKVNDLWESISKLHGVIEDYREDYFYKKHIDS